MVNLEELKATARSVVESTKRATSRKSEHRIKRLTSKMRRQADKIDRLAEDLTSARSEGRTGRTARIERSDLTYYLSEELAGVRKTAVGTFDIMDQVRKEEGKSRDLDPECVWYKVLKHNHGMQGKLNAYAAGLLVAFFTSTLLFCSVVSVLAVVVPDASREFIIIAMAFAGLFCVLLLFPVTRDVAHWAAYKKGVRELRKAPLTVGDVEREVELLWEELAGEVGKFSQSAAWGVRRTLRELTAFQTPWSVTLLRLAQAESVLFWVRESGEKGGRAE